MTSFYAHQLLILFVTVAVVLGCIFIRPQRRSHPLLVVLMMTVITAVVLIVLALTHQPLSMLIVSLGTTVAIVMYAFGSIRRRRTLIAGCVIAVPCFLAAYPIAQHFDVGTPGLLSVSATEGVIVALTFMWLWPMGMTSLWWSHDFNHETTISGDERTKRHLTDIND